MSICTVEGFVLMRVTSCALEGVPTFVPGKKTLNGLGVNVVPAAMRGRSSKAGQQEKRRQRDSNQ